MDAGWLQDVSYPIDHVLGAVSPRDTGQAPKFKATSQHTGLASRVYVTLSHLVLYLQDRRGDMEQRILKVTAPCDLKLVSAISDLIPTWGLDTIVPAVAH